jgi:hypothetical protein
VKGNDGQKEGEEEKLNVKEDERKEKKGYNGRRNCTRTWIGRRTTKRENKMKTESRKRN